jgi:integrase
LLLGFAAALRRSEIVRLDVADVHFVERGIEVRITFSKTDQQGEGELVPVAFGSKDACPVRGVHAWLDKSGLLEGALFPKIRRDGSVGGRLQEQEQAVDRAVKRAVERAGLDSRSYGAHSLKRLGDERGEKRKGPRRHHEDGPVEERAHRARIHPPWGAVRLVRE